MRAGHGQAVSARRRGNIRPAAAGRPHTNFPDLVSEIPVIVMVYTADCRNLRAENQQKRLYRKIELWHELYPYWSF